MADYSKRIKPTDYSIGTFFGKRIDLLIQALPEKLNGISFDVVDTREAAVG